MLVNRSHYNPASDAVFPENKRKLSRRERERERERGGKLKNCTAGFYIDITARKFTNGEKLRRKKGRQS
jgi:hypothetical protein